MFLVCGIAVISLSSVLPSDYTTYLWCNGFRLCKHCIERHFQLSFISLSDSKKLLKFSSSITYLKPLCKGGENVVCDVSITIFDYITVWCIDQSVLCLSLSGVYWWLLTVCMELLLTVSLWMICLCSRCFCRIHIICTHSVRNFITQWPWLRARLRRLVNRKWSSLAVVGWHRLAGETTAERTVSKPTGILVILTQGKSRSWWL